MASTPQGRDLTEQHRQAQQQLRAAFLLEFLALWPLLDSTNLDRSSPSWVRAVLRVIRAFRLQSAQVSTRYFVEFQAVEAPSSPARPRIERVDTPRLELPSTASRPTPTPARRSIPAPTPTTSSELPRSNGRLRRADARPAPAEVVPEFRFDFDESAFEPGPQRQARIELPDIDWGPSDRAAVVSMNVTGPSSQKSKARRGKPLQVARDESFTEAAGAATRHVLTGGRQSLLTLVQDDMQALGWIRVTDGDPCAFCALLASRGPVYKTEQSAGFQPHDACACQPEPVYSRSTLWPGRGAEFRSLYRDATRGTSGRDSINAFRRAYEQQQRDSRTSVAS